ncbi:MAG: Ferredoxin fas2 [Candidatus Anoxychlamydiales bacterium]|nr:Ferredoxin fas2 [Candidatus Anoxychlamydiales bacterium]
MQKHSISFLKNLANTIRYQLIEMSHIGKASHLGSSLSCVDLIIAAYWRFLNVNPMNPLDPNRDRFILSKGHAVSTLYAVLSAKGFFKKALLKTFNQEGSSLPEHPTPKCIPGLEAATGSLGHGLSLGIGHALAGKIMNKDYKVVVLLSDGECNEGSVWEAAMFAPKKNLNNLITIVDYNKWQATGKSEEIMQISPLKEKWQAFGWQTYEIDGNDLQDILNIFEKNSSREKPIAIIAHTIKGKGISFMENDNNWHYRIPTQEEVKLAKEELKIGDHEKCFC